MSWAGPEDVYLSTSLASYLDSRVLQKNCFLVLKYCCLSIPLNPGFNVDFELSTSEKMLEFRTGGSTNHFFTVEVWWSNAIIHAAEKLLVLLRDGRKLLGILRSFDQFANAVLEGACERVIVGDLYCDIPLGLYVIRGENVVLIGELDSEREELPPHMTRVSAAEIKRAQKAEREASDLKGTMRKRMEFLDMD
ncbi:hypothetical protein ACFX13_047115 [Malus domestica]|uniref:sm-like protein LSM1B isoform X1 n=1 Tax=Malus domestica TaxID=3750 RepID=UPI0039748721